MAININELKGLLDAHKKLLKIEKLIALDDKAFEDDIIQLMKEVEEQL